jgi:hypothetical protein
MPLIGESAKLEIRANFYNLFNNLNLRGGCNWNAIQCNINDPQFGHTNGALGSRTIEMQARFNF